MSVSTSGEAPFCCHTSSSVPVTGSTRTLGQRDWYAPRCRIDGAISVAPVCPFRSRYPSAWKSGDWLYRSDAMTRRRSGSVEGNEPKSETWLSDVGWKRT